MTIGDQEAPYGQPRVQPTIKDKFPFDVQKEKEWLFDAIHEFINKIQALESTSIPILREGRIPDMPQRFEQLLQRKLTDKVNKLKDFFKFS